MAQTGFTPISLYYTTTASATPTAGNLVAGELAINTADGKLFYKDSSGVVQTIASKATGTVAGTTTQVIYNNAGAYAGSANFVFDGTRVGISVSSPRRNLEVGGTIAAPTVLATAISTSASGTVVIADTGTTVGAVIGTALNGSSYDTYMQARNLGAASTSYNLLFNPLGGNVGIGFNSPTAKLDVLTNSTTAEMNLRAWGQSTTTTNAINFWYLDAGGSPYNNTSIKSLSTANAGNGNLVFYTTPTSGSLTERMRIDSSGNVMMGTTTPSTTSLLSLQKSSVSSTYGNGVIQNIFNSGATSTTRGYNSVLRLASNGGSADCNVVMTDNTDFNYFFGGYQGTLYCMGGTSGGVGLSQGGTSWSSLSDATLKNVTGTYSTALADIAQIEPVKFTWIDDADNKPCVGVIAQSVQKVIPEAVETNKEGILSVRYTEIIPLLIASIQELNAKVDAQATEIATLKAK